MGKINKGLLMVAVFAVTAFGTASAAFAQVDPTLADDLGDAIDESFADTSGFIMTRAVPVMLGAIVLGLIIRIAFRWIRKAGRAVG